MISKLKKFLRGEGGITGLETAIILIAFVVVAAVFAFTVLSAGIFSSEKGKEAVYSGLAEVRGSVEIRSSVIAKSTQDDKVTSLIFTIANVAGGEPLDLTEPEGTEAFCTVQEGCTYTAAGTDHVFVIDYRDEDQVLYDLPWTREWRGQTDADELLEDGELAEITVPLYNMGDTGPADGGTQITDVCSPPLGINTRFALDMKPPAGGTIVIEKLVPSTIDAVMDLK